VNPIKVDGETYYRLGVVSKSNVTPFRPDIPSPNIFKKDKAFRDLLLTKGGCDVLNSQL
jgi:hypothetical protein